MSEQVETFIKKAKTAAGMIQADLAKAVEGFTASEASRAERGAEGQSAESSKAVPGAAAATDLSKADAPSAEEAPCAEKETASNTEGKAEPVLLTADERELLALYKAASADTKKVAMFVLKSEKQLVPQIMSMLAGVLGNGGANTDNPLAKLSGGSKGADNPVQGVIGGLIGMVGGLMGKKGSSEQPDKQISGSLLVFTYLYSISIYILLLSFYFWLWRTDIKPEKQESSQPEPAAQKK